MIITRGINSRIGGRTQLLGRGAAVFSSLSLFASGDEGAWYDPSDLTTLYQDSAGTTAVTADGDPVGYMGDKSGNGNHATQSTSAARPVYRTDGTLHWLELDGVDDFLFKKSPAGLTAVSEVFAIVAGSADTTGVKGIFAASNFALTADDDFVLFRPAGTTSGFRGNDSSFISYSYGVSASTDFITSMDLGSSDQDFRLNGSIVNQTTVSTGGFEFGDSITIGNSDDSLSQFWDGRFYGALLLDRRATSTEISDTESYLADKAGVTL